MTAPSEGGAFPARHPSARVRLEAALLDADWTAPAPADSRAAAPGEVVPSTVLVVAAEADVRRYVRECLRERPAVHVVEAATIPAAVALAARHAPVCVVVDAPERYVLLALASPCAVLLVDEVPRGGAASATRLRLLARPFTARELLVEVDRLLG